MTWIGTDVDNHEETLVRGGTGFRWCRRFGGRKLGSWSNSCIGTNVPGGPLRSSRFCAAGVIAIAFPSLIDPTFNVDELAGHELIARLGPVQVLIPIARLALGAIANRLLT